jgi:hypothetical protein
VGTAAVVVAETHKHLYRDPVIATITVYWI